jgi:hypothetical protein
MDQLPAGPPEPPWVFHRGSEPTDGCWRQGPEEAWLLDVWLPYWLAASPTERAAYLERHRPVGLWAVYLTEVWAGEAASQDDRQK